jgi:hypothetical protein
MGVAFCGGVKSRLKVGRSKALLSSTSFVVFLSSPSSLVTLRAWLNMQVMHSG